MNEKKLIKTQFRFLEKDGFKRSISQINGELDFNYRKNDIAFEITCDTSSITIDVVVDDKGERVNLLFCKMFNGTELEKLKWQIDLASAQKNLYYQIVLYSGFIKNRIDKDWH